MKLILCLIAVLGLTISCAKKKEEEAKSNSANPFPKISADCGAQKCI